MSLAEKKKEPDHLPVYGPGPVYVGSIVLLTAAAVFLCKLPLVFWVFMTILMKGTEEKWLKGLYGQEYENYCKRDAVKASPST